MADPNHNPESNNRLDDHAVRVHQAFDTFHKSVGDRVSKEDEMRVLGIREAAAERDKARVEEHIEKTKEKSNWIVEELAKHPEISSIFRELSIMGF
jgi:hypothetical protein